MTKKLLNAMGIRLVKRLQSNSKNTISDIDPIGKAGNDFPSFVLEKFSTLFIKALDDLREFISIYFPLHVDMQFYSDLHDNQQKKTEIITRYHDKYFKIYINKCPNNVKSLLEKLYLLDYYQINAIFFVIASNNLFVLTVFKTTSLKTLTDKLTAQIMIYKYGNKSQQSKYLNHTFNFLFLVNETNFRSNEILSTKTFIKSNANALAQSVVLKGEKTNVGIDCNNLVSNVLLIYVKDEDKTKTKSLKESLGFLIVDMNDTFINKIQKIKCYSLLTIDYYHLKFNSVSLESSYTLKLSKSGIDGFEIFCYQLYIKQVLFNTGMLSQAQQLINFILQEANEKYTLLLSPPKATKLIKADHFKSNLGKLFLELKQQISYNFSVCSDLNSFTNENTVSNFAIAKLSVPQKCHQIFDWVFSVMESDVCMSTNSKFIQSKFLLQKYQLEDKSGENLLYAIGKQKVTGFLRIKRGLNTFKLKNDQQEPEEDKENSIKLIATKDREEKMYNNSIKSAISDILSSRGSLMSAENTNSYSTRPFSSGNNIN